MRDALAWYEALVTFTAQLGLLREWYLDYGRAAECLALLLSHHAARGERAVCDQLCRRAMEYLTVAQGRTDPLSWQGKMFTRVAVLLVQKWQDNSPLLGRPPIGPAGSPGGKAARMSVRAARPSPIEGSGSDNSRSTRAATVLRNSRVLSGEAEDSTWITTVGWTSPRRHASMILAAGPSWWSPSRNSMSRAVHRIGCTAIERPGVADGTRGFWEDEAKSGATVRSR